MFLYFLFFLFRSHLSSFFISKGTNICLTLFHPAPNSSGSPGRYGTCWADPLPFLWFWRCFPNLLLCASPPRSLGLLSHFIFWVQGPGAGGASLVSDFPVFFSLEAAGFLAIFFKGAIFFPCCLLFSLKNPLLEVNQAICLVICYLLGTKFFKISAQFVSVATV